MTQNSVDQPYQSTKGDLMGGTGSGGRPAILPIGSNSQVLTADSTQTTGMKWATNTPSGSVIQQVYNSTNTFATTSTVIPYDDTIPQITEGTEVLTCSITPTNSSNFLMIDFGGFVFNEGVPPGTVALFQDATANALNAVAVAILDGGSTIESWNSTFLRFRMTAGTTSSTTFRIRIGTGNAANQISLNGNGSRKYGGAAVASLTIWEVVA